MKVGRIFGPPGTGKTTALLGLVEWHLRNGVHPQEVGFVAFTRAAAREARGRARQAFPSLGDEDLRWFRTIHSLCYRLLGLARGSVVTEAKVQEFSRLYGYEITPCGERDGAPEDYEVQEVMLRTLGDYLLFFEDWRRNLMLWDIEQAYSRFLSPGQLPRGWSLAQVRQFHQRYRQWKAENGLVDFADMLMLVLRERLAPQVSVLITDEGQDLSPLQAEVVRLWASGARVLYLAGDPDQTIFTFSGADPRLFLDWPSHGDKHLTQSHRVPRRIHDVALRFIRRNRNRIDVPYKPRDEEGFVRAEPINSLNLERLAGEGSVLLLARNRFLLREYVDLLTLRGLPFEALRGTSPLKPSATIALTAGLRLARGEQVSVREASHFIDLIPSNGYLVRGAKARFKELVKECPEASIGAGDMGVYLLPRLQGLLARGEGAFIQALRLSPREKGYFRRLLTRWGEGALTEPPRVKVGTVHSAKGMEADFVVLRLDMANRTYQEWLDSPEGERRVFYVGMTRARKGLILLEPCGSRFIDLWGEIR